MQNKILSLICGIIVGLIFLVNEVQGFFFLIPAFEKLIINFITTPASPATPKIVIVDQNPMGRIYEKFENKTIIVTGIDTGWKKCPRIPLTKNDHCLRNAQIIGYIEHGQEILLEKPIKLDSIYITKGIVDPWRNTTSQKVKIYGKLVLVGKSFVIDVEKIVPLVSEINVHEFINGNQTNENETVCVQVITYAINPTTGECVEFPTPCDVPEGWKIVDKCPNISIPPLPPPLPIYSNQTEENATKCPEVITYAVNPETNECKAFPTPCVIPEGWKIVKECPISTTNQSEVKYVKLTGKIEKMEISSVCPQCGPGMICSTECVDYYYVTLSNVTLTYLKSLDSVHYDEIVANLHGNIRVSENDVGKILTVYGKLVQDYSDKELVIEVEQYILQIERPIINIPETLLPYLNKTIKVWGVDVGHSPDCQGLVSLTRNDHCLTGAGIIEVEGQQISGIYIGNIYMTKGLDEALNKKIPVEVIGKLIPVKDPTRNIVGVVLQVEKIERLQPPSHPNNTLEKVDIKGTIVNTRLSNNSVIVTLLPATVKICKEGACSQKNYQKAIDVVIYGNIDYKKLIMGATFVINGKLKDIKYDIRDTFVVELQRYTIKVSKNNNISIRTKVECFANRTCNLHIYIANKWKPIAGVLVEYYYDENELNYTSSRKGSLIEKWTLISTGPYLDGYKRRTAIVGFLPIDINQQGEILVLTFRKLVNNSKLCMSFEFSDDSGFNLTYVPGTCVTF